MKYESRTNLLFCRFVGFYTDVSVLHGLLHDGYRVGTLGGRVDSHGRDGGSYLGKLRGELQCALFVRQLELALS